MAQFQLIESPNEWLARRVKERNIPYSRLARLQGVDKSLFGRWIKGEEQIPRPALALLAQQLPPSDLSYLLRLKDCEDLADVMKRQAYKLLSSLSIGQRPVEALFCRIQELITQEQSAAPQLRAESLAYHFTDAIAAVQLVLQTVNTSYLHPFLPPESVPRFRYPINHFVGLLLELDHYITPGTREATAVSDFRESLLANLRRVVWAKGAAHPMGVLAQQFSTHLLARHGITDDREAIKDLLEHRADSTDPLLRRLSFTGLVLGRRDPDISGRFLWSLRRDRSLADANLFFNAFHYGDIVLESHRPVPTGPKNFAQSIPHILRHLEQAEQYVSILDTEVATLIHVLESTGPEQFLIPSTVSRLRSLLRDDSTLLNRLGKDQLFQFHEHLRRIVQAAA